MIVRFIVARTRGLDFKSPDICRADFNVMPDGKLTAGFLFSPASLLKRRAETLKTAISPTDSHSFVWIAQTSL